MVLDSDWRRQFVCMCVHLILRPLSVCVWPKLQLGPHGAVTVVFNHRTVPPITRVVSYS